jgi:hypothetical protein
MFIVFIVSAICVSSASAQTGLLSKALAAASAGADKTNSRKTGAAGTTRVAVFNVAAVFNKYKRAIDCKDELSREIKEMQEEAKQLTENLTKWQASLQKNEFPNKRELYEEKIINARRRLEDMNREARVKVGKAQEANLILLWSDIRAAVKAYAANHDIDLVIAYGDAREADQNLFPNISRKMAAIDQGGSMPFLIGPGVDISDGLVDLLNRQYREKQSNPAEDEDR